MSDTPKPPPRRTTSSARRKAPPKPPNTVSPGWIHDALSAVTLNALRSATDGQLNVGNVADDFVARIPGAEDGPEPTVLLSRIYAHLGHRLPLIRRVERRLEGRDRSSGIGSDMLALAAQLYLRNRDLAPQLAALVKTALDSRGKVASQEDPSTKTAPVVPFYVPGASGEGSSSA